MSLSTEFLGEGIGDLGECGVLQVAELPRSGVFSSNAKIVGCVGDVEISGGLIGAMGGGGGNPNIGGGEKFEGMDGFSGNSGDLAECIESESIVIKGEVRGQDDNKRSSGGWVIQGSHTIRSRIFEMRCT